MKKLLMLTAIAVLSTSLTFAQDDSSDSSGIHFGAKAGVNFATLSKDEGFKPDGRTSFHVGAVVNIGISEKFSLQPEIVYSSQGFKEKFEEYYPDIGTVSVEHTAKMDYINIPVLAGYRIIDGLVVQAGPQFGILISAKEDWEASGGGETQEDTVDFKDDLKTLDIGFGFGAQYKLDFGLFFQARYVLGVNKVFDYDDANDHKNRVASLSVGYFFN